MIGKKQRENVEYFKCLCYTITNYARYILEIKSRIAMAKASFNKKTNLCTSKLDFNWRKKLVNCYMWSIALYGAETWTFPKLYQKYLESFELWCWRRMEKISWTDRVRNEALHSAKKERNILRTIKRKKCNWIDHILCRNCLLKYVIEGKIEEIIEVIGRRERRRRKQLLDDLKKRTGYRKLKEK